MFSVNLSSLEHNLCDLIVQIDNFNDRIDVLKNGEINKVIVEKTSNLKRCIWGFSYNFRTGRQVTNNSMVFVNHSILNIYDHLVKINPELITRIVSMYNILVQFNSIFPLMARQNQINYLTANLIDIHTCAKRGYKLKSTSKEVAETMNKILLEFLDRGGTVKFLANREDKVIVKNLNNLVLDAKNSIFSDIFECFLKREGCTSVKKICPGLFLNPNRNEYFTYRHTESLFEHSEFKKYISHPLGIVKSLKGHNWNETSYWKTDYGIRLLTDDVRDDNSEPGEYNKLLADVNNPATVFASSKITLFNFMQRMLKSGNCNGQEIILFQMEKLEPLCQIINEFHLINLSIPKPKQKPTTPRAPINYFENIQITNEDDINTCQEGVKPDLDDSIKETINHFETAFQELLERQIEISGKSKG